MYEATFEGDLNHRIPPNRKRQRPIYKWTQRALIEYWNDIKAHIPGHSNTDFDYTDEIKRHIKDHANAEDN